ncbi:sodium/hydrogen exchanger [Thermocrinis albus DSM 14484]|uniref:Sodium/hydrogen exchanger n=1 Tax=Thermocrinis albus (strain DSM 14484 / JCM 11386 / HI 11/12) TaxID=638303 RepID=D3SQG7_THEAH|nr:cation:proton antiporter [Thermocrinis albus]ADC89404.1 sodium/hydrogen exchanger [Thermocrinis albus DSM 14484]
MMHHLLLDLALILFLARLMGDVLARFGLPSVLGEILVGVLLGQSVLGLVQPHDLIRVLAELGIILLLFQVGLEADIHQLRKVGFHALLVASLGAFTPLLLGYWVGYHLLDMSHLQSLFLGGTLAATSIGITVRALQDLGMMKERFAQIVLGAAVLDDIMGVILLAGLYELSRSGSLQTNTLLLMILYIATFFVLSPLAAQFMAFFIRVLSRLLRTMDFVPPAILSLVFLLAYLAHRVGSPEILGSFTAGLALSRRFFLPFATFLRTDEKMAHKIEESIIPLVWVFSPIFFVYVGLELNLKAVDILSGQFWKYAVPIAVVALVSKLVAGALSGRNMRERFLIGLAMLPRGEVGLIFAELGRRGGIYDDLMYAVIVFVVALTTLISPLALRYIEKLAG